MIGAQHLIPIPNPRFVDCAVRIGRGAAKSNAYCAGHEAFRMRRVRRGMFQAVSSSNAHAIVVVAPRVQGGEPEYSQGQSRRNEVEDVIKSRGDGARLLD